ncbi:MAG: PAS domain S-box-containing protein [Bacteriovoracaceae bacterium]|jgi:PAS domain S-box-containing protein
MLKDVLIDKHIYELVHNELIYSKTDEKGVIVEVNDKFCDLSGYCREELIGENHRKVKSGNHSEQFYKKMWEVISSGEVWKGIIENKNKEGSHYFVKAIISPCFDSNQKITGYISIRNDVTKEVRIRKDLKKTVRMLNETSTISKVGGWELNVQTKELNWSDETFRILEVDKRELSTPTLPDGLSLYTEESRPIIEEAVKQAMNKGVPYSLELQAKTAKGNVIWVHTNGKANYKEGKIISLSGTIQDINDKKKAELNYEEERIKNVHSSKLASLGEMSAGIAHEINNPLAIISGCVTILQKREQTPEQLQSRIESIEKSTERIARIVASLKKFSRFGDKQDYTPHKLSSIVKESLILTEIKAKRHDVELTCEIESDALILCDEVEIEQVLINLVNNACDAVKDLEERWIKIELKEKKSLLSLTITDSGKGIPEEQASKMFDPFYTSKVVGEGTGLGLSITASILNQHNAIIKVNRSCPNTQFIILFNKYTKAELE